MREWTDGWVKMRLEQSVPTWVDRLQEHPIQLSCGSTPSSSVTWAAVALETSVFPSADWGYHLPVSHQPVKVKVEGREGNTPWKHQDAQRQSADGKIKSRPSHTGW